MQVNVTYFSSTGVEQTNETLQLTSERARALGIKHILVPTTSGATAIKALQSLKEYKLIVVTHMTGFAKPGENQLQSGHRLTLEKSNEI